MRYTAAGVSTLLRCNSTVTVPSTATTVLMRTVQPGVDAIGQSESSYQPSIRLAVKKSIIELYVTM